MMYNFCIFKLEIGVGMLTIFLGEFSRTVWCEVSTPIMVNKALAHLGVAWMKDVNNSTLSNNPQKSEKRNKINGNYIHRT